MKQRLIIVAGTRPEIIKIYPVINALENKSIEYTFVWSGQHYDFEMSTIFFKELNIREPDIILNVPRGSDLMQQVSSISLALIRKVIAGKSSIIYALGDTSTTLAAALASFYSGNIFVHDEAGVRSHDPFMIEECHRKLADTLAAYHFAPTSIAVLNLLVEGTLGESIFLTGSTLVDTFGIFYNRISSRKYDVLSKIGVEGKDFAVVTVHRRENLREGRLRKVVALLKTIASKYDYDIVFPIHPHTYLKLQKYGLLEELLSIKSIKLIKPLGYFDFLSLLSASSFIMTDSGGVQQEGFLAGKYILTLRPYTEWVETVLLGYNFIVDVDTKSILRIINNILDGTLKPEKISMKQNPMGDGASGMRVARILAVLAENIKSAQDIRKYRSSFYEAHTRMLMMFPRLSGIRNNITSGVKLCFDKHGMPIIYIDRVTSDNEIRINRTKCLQMERFDSENIEYNKEKFSKLIRVDWRHIDKMLDSVLIK